MTESKIVNELKKITELGINNDVVVICKLVDSLIERIENNPLLPCEVYFKWICPSCKHTCRRNYEDTATAGEPYCANCEDTMELASDEYQYKDK